MGRPRCAQIQAWLAADVEGALPRRRAARVAAHVAECPACAAEQAALLRVGTVLAALPLQPVPPNQWRGVDARLAAEPPVVRRRRPALAWAGATVVLAAIVAAVAVPVWRNTQPRPAESNSRYVQEHHRAAVAAVPLANSAFGDVLVAVAKEEAL